MVKLNDSSVKSAVRVLNVLEAVVAIGRPISANEILSLVPMPPSSLSYLLGTLVSLNYLERSGRLYATGPAIAKLSPAFTHHSLRDAMSPIVTSLRDQLDESATFFLEYGWQVEALVCAEGGQALRYAVAEGQRVPMHAMAAGKALLAALSEDRLADYFAEASLERFTKNTICDEATLRAELEQVRSQGFAQTCEEYSLGIVGLAQTVIREGTVVGALAVAIPAARFTPDTLKRSLMALKKCVSLAQVQ